MRKSEAIWRLAILAWASAVSFVPVAAAASEDDSLPRDALARIEAEIARFQKENAIPGVSVAIASRKGVLWAKGFGVSDVENGTPVTEHSVFRFASISKVLTAVTAMELAETGRLDLDLPVQRYCPHYPAKVQPITTLQLLAHTAGVRHYRDDYSDYENTKFYPTVESGLVIFKDDPLLFAPGAFFSYSTFGYNVIGCAIEGATGQAFPEVLQSRILAPAGMTETRVDAQAAVIPNRAQGYVKTEAGSLLNSGLADTSYKIPGGGLAGTASDLARFAAALLSGKLVSSASLARMTIPSPELTPEGEPSEYGLGLQLETRGDLREVFHGGAQHRVTNVMMTVPDQDLIVVVLSNLEDVSIKVLARAIVDLALGREVTPLAERLERAKSKKTWSDRVKS